MLKALLVLVALSYAFAGTVCAQDTLMMRNGDTILAKVEVVGINEIEYHRPDNLTGPVYVVAKADVFMIRYENGSHDVFTNTETRTPVPPAVQPTPGGEGKSRPSQNYVQLNRMASRRITAGAIITGAGGIILATGIGLIQADVKQFNQSGTTPARAGIGSLLIAASIAALIVGPVTLGKGFKYRHMAQRAASNTLSFNPAANSTPYRYSPTNNQTSFGGLTFAF